MQQAIFSKRFRLFPALPLKQPGILPVVAGDWSDFIDLGTSDMARSADVSGKGMSAALLMSATRAILRSL